MNKEEVAKKLIEKGLTLSSVESLTGGLFASEMTSISGASHFFKGALVTYMSEEKVRLLGILYDDIDKYGVISKEIAALMAINGAIKMKSDICVSFTGNAGPDAMEGKPVGLVYIGLYSHNVVSVHRYELSGSRIEIRNKCIDIAIELLSDTIN
jgi:PncC family amidohydrolase